MKYITYADCCGMATELLTVEAGSAAEAVDFTRQACEAAGKEHISLWALPKREGRRGLVKINVLIDEIMEEIKGRVR